MQWTFWKYKPNNYCGMFFKIIFLIPCAICRPKNKSIPTPVRLVDGGSRACNTLCKPLRTIGVRGWKLWRSKKTREIHKYLCKTIMFAWQCPVYIIIERFICDDYAFPDNAVLRRTVLMLLPICFWLQPVLQLDLSGTFCRVWWGWKLKTNDYENEIISLIESLFNI